MRILLAQNSGFCFGVRRAVELAERACRENGTVYSYGPIIHNSAAVDELREHGLVPVFDVSALSPGSTIVIRAHGVPPEVYEACNERGLSVIDATCPFVKRIHTIVTDAHARGRSVVIAGKPEHPEVVGICGYAGADAHVVETPEDVMRLPRLSAATLVSQTTLSDAAFAAIETALLLAYPDTEVFRTICDTTRARQNEAVHIAQESTKMLVLGARESANTMRLAQLCEKSCKSTRIIESIDKLFLDNLQPDDIIGVVAGASTPDRMIREVLQVMSELEKATIDNTQADASAETVAVTEPDETLKQTVAEAADDIAQAAGKVVDAVKEQVTKTVESARESAADAAAEPKAAAEAIGEKATIAAETAEYRASETVAAAKAKAEEATEAAKALKAKTEEAAEAAKAKAEEAAEAAKAKTAEVAETVQAKAAEAAEAAKTKAAELKEKLQSAAESVKVAAENSEFAQAFEKTMTRIHNGQIVEGTVLSVVDGEVFVNIGYKSDGVIPKNEISGDSDAKAEDLFKEGDKIDVEVMKVNDGEGNVLLSRKNVESKKIWDELMSQEDIEDRVFEATGKEVVKGGIIADIGGIRAFVPASQVSVKYIENLSEFVGKPMKLKVLEVDKQRKRIVVSQKQVMLAEAAAEKRAKWETLVVGSKIPGVVRRITDFGAFVDIGGIDGLVHVTDAAWGRVKHPSDVFSIGQEIEVLVLNVDVEKERVSLGYKQLQPKPWTTADQKYPVGSIVEGKVVRIVPFGAFVALESTIDGLIHISQVSVHRIAKVEDELKVGDVVRCKVLEVNPEAKRISLSRKEALLEEDPDLAAQLEAERAERDRQYAERQEQRQQQREQQQQQRASRDTSSRGSSERSSSASSDRRDSGSYDRRRRNSEDGEYELPPVQEATTSLASLFKGLKVDDDE